MYPCVLVCHKCDWVFSGCPYGLMGCFGREPWSVWCSHGGVGVKFLCEVKVGYEKFMEVGYVPCVRRGVPGCVIRFDYLVVNIPAVH